MKNKIVGFLNIFSTSIIILFIYFSGHSITSDVLVPLFSNTLNTAVLDKLKLVSTQIAIDTALLNMLINLIFLKLVNVVSVYVNIKNNERTKELFLPVKKPKTKNVEICIRVNYKFLWLKKLCLKLGGTYIFIHVPEKINYAIKNAEDFNAGSINDTDEQYLIKLNLCRCLDRNEVRKDIYLSLSLSAKSTYVNDYAIITSLICADGTGSIRKSIAYFITYLLSDINLDKHVIRARDIK